MNIRIGSGIDFHRFAAQRKCIIGGITIPYHQGLLGHSDADVLLHAIADALLGALALGDIGKHFPDTDPAYKDIDSKLLLQKVVSLIHEAHYTVGNIDCTLCLEQPKIAPYIAAMKRCIAPLLALSEDAVSIKATTTETMGAIGRKEGVCAMATVLLIKTQPSL